MKKLGLSEEEQLTVTLLLSEKKLAVEEELRLLTPSCENMERKQSELDQEISLIESIMSKVSNRKIVCGREVNLKIKTLKFNGYAKVDPNIQEGVVYCSQSLFDGETLRFQMYNKPNIVTVEEFMIDSDGYVYMPMNINIAGEEVIVSFQLKQCSDYQEHSVVIGRNPIQGMLLDPSYPEDEFSEDGFFLFEGMGED